MNENINTFDFINPIGHIEIGDKPIKLSDISDNLQTGNLVVVFADSNKDFENLTKKLCNQKDLLVLNKGIKSISFLKKKAQKLNKTVFVKLNTKKLDKYKRKRSFIKNVSIALCINHKPYYYIAGCKNHSTDFNIGWTVIGIAIIKC